MGTLIYSAIMSLDGYIEDEGGRFDWAEPDEEVHAFVNALERPIGTYLYGRRMYEVMAAWETDRALSDQSAVFKDFADIWQKANKVVFSRGLAHASTARTRIEREFVPQSIRRMKEAEAGDLTIGGPGVAGHAFKAGLVDECQLFVAPVIVGGGKRCLPDDVFVGLELIDEHRFAGGFVFLRYKVESMR